MQLYIISIGRKARSYCMDERQWCDVMRWRYFDHSSDSFSPPHFGYYEESEPSHSCSDSSESICILFLLDLAFRTGFLETTTSTCSLSSSSRMFRKVFGLLGTGWAWTIWIEPEEGLFFSSYILRFTREIRSSGSCLTGSRLFYFLERPLVLFFTFILSSCFSVLGCSDCDSSSVSQFMAFFSDFAFSFSLPLPYFLLFFLALRPLLPLILSSPFLRYSSSSA